MLKGRSCGDDIDRKTCFEIPKELSSRRCVILTCCPHPSVRSSQRPTYAQQHGYTHEFSVAETLHVNSRHNKRPCEVNSAIVHSFCMCATGCYTTRSSGVLLRSGCGALLLQHLLAHLPKALCYIRSFPVRRPGLQDGLDATGALGLGQRRPLPLTVLKVPSTKLTSQPRPKHLDGIQIWAVRRDMYIHE